MDNKCSQPVPFYCTHNKTKNSPLLEMSYYSFHGAGFSSRGQEAGEAGIFGHKFSICGVSY